MATQTFFSFTLFKVARKIVSSPSKHYERRAVSPPPERRYDKGIMTPSVRYFLHAKSQLQQFLIRNEIDQVAPIRNHLNLVGLSQSRHIVQVLIVPMNLLQPNMSDLVTKYYMKERSRLRKVIHWFNNLNTPVYHILLL